MYPALGRGEAHFGEADARAAANHGPRFTAYFDSTSIVQD